LILDETQSLVAPVPQEVSPPVSAHLLSCLELLLAPMLPIAFTYGGVQAVKSFATRMNTHVQE
jgi:hypothetical protein